MVLSAVPTRNGRPIRNKNRLLCRVRRRKTFNPCRTVWFNSKKYYLKNSKFCWVIPWLKFWLTMAPWSLQSWCFSKLQNSEKILICNGVHGPMEPPSFKWISWSKFFCECSLNRKKTIRCKKVHEKSKKNFSNTTHRKMANMSCWVWPCWTVPCHPWKSHKSHCNAVTILFRATLTLLCPVNWPGPKAPKVRPFWKKLRVFSKRHKNQAQVRTRHRNTRLPNPTKKVQPVQRPDLRKSFFPVLPTHPRLDHPYVDWGLQLPKSSPVSNKNLQKALQLNPIRHPISRRKRMWYFQGPMQTVRLPIKKLNEFCLNCLPNWLKKHRSKEILPVK